MKLLNGFGSKLISIQTLTSFPPFDDGTLWVHPYKRLGRTLALVDQLSNLIQRLTNRYR